MRLIRGKIVALVAALALLLFFSNGVYAYELRGNAVILENELFRVEQSPHTLTGLDNFVQLKIRNKDVSPHSIDVAFGLDAERVTPTRLFVWENAPRTVTEWGWVSKEYVCKGVFDYTLNPNYAWCFQGLNKTVVFQRSFTSVNPETQAVYYESREPVGTKTEYVWDWTRIPNKFTRVSWRGKNWVEAESAWFDAGEEKTLAVQVQVPPNQEGKYDWFFKFDSVSFEEAFESRRYLWLDPWFNSSVAYKQVLNISVSTGLLVANETTLNYSLDTASLIAAGRMQADCDDLWIVVNDSIALDREVRDCNTSNTVVRHKVWSNVSSSVNQDYSLYYGNNASSAPSTDYTRVYKVYDGFSGGAVNASLWNVVSGTVATHNGFLYGQTAGLIMEIQSVGSYGAQSVFEFWANSTNENHEIFGLGCGVGNYLVLYNGLSPGAYNCSNNNQDCFSTNYANGTILGTDLNSVYFHGTPMRHRALVNNATATGKLVDWTTLNTTHQFDRTSTSNYEWYMQTGGGVGYLWVDNASIWLFNPNASVLFGSREYRINTTIHVPLNSTYTSSFTTSYEFTADVFATANCTSYLDGSWVDSVIASNGSVYGDSLSGLASGPHYYTVNCSNGSAEGNAAVFFSVLNHVYVYAFDEETNDRIWFDVSFDNSTNTTVFSNVYYVNESSSTLPQGNVWLTVSNSSFYDRLYYLNIHNDTSTILNTYLLNKSADVIFVRFHIRSYMNVPVENASISMFRVVGGNTVTVGQGVSDAAGDVSFYLELDAPYWIQVTHPLYNLFYSSLSPTANDYTIYLTGTGAGGAGNYTLTNTFEDLQWVLLPYTRSIANETMNITLIVYSANASLNYFGLNVSWNGSLLFSQNVTGQPSGGVIYYVVNASNLTNNVTVCYWFSRSPDFIGEAVYWIYDVAMGATRTFTEWQEDYAATGLSNVTLAILALLVTLFVGAWVARRGNKTAAAVVMFAVLALLCVVDWLSVTIPLGGGAGMRIHSWGLMTFTLLVVGSAIYLQERV